MSSPVFGNEELKDFSAACQKTQVVYQVAERFCERFSERYILAVTDIDRFIHDGRRSMIDYQLSPESSFRDLLKTLGYLRLTMAELKDEFTDFLEAKNYSRWKGNSPQAVFVYKLCGDKVISYQSCSEYVENNNADRVANILICMIDHVDLELNKEIHSIEREIKRQLSITKIKSQMTT